MSAKQAINDKLQGSIATNLRCGGAVSNQIKESLLPSMRVKKNKNRWVFGKVASKSVVEIWQNYGDEYVAPRFWPTLYISCVRRPAPLRTRCTIRLDPGHSTKRPATTNSSQRTINRSLQVDDASLFLSVEPIKAGDGQHRLRASNTDTRVGSCLYADQISCH